MLEPKMPFVVISKACVKTDYRILKHPEKPTLRVTVPFHNKDLKRRTLESIIKQSTLTYEEFLKLL